MSISSSVWPVWLTYTAGEEQGSDPPSDRYNSPMSVVERFVLFLSAVLAIWLGAHLYIGWRLLGLPVFAAGTPRTVLWAVLVAGFFAYPAGRFLWYRGLERVGGAVEWIGAAWMGTVFLLLTGLLASEVLTVAGALGPAWTRNVRTAAAAVAVLLAVVALAGGQRPPRVLRVEAEVPGLQPSLEGITVIQLSDLHLGSLLGERFLERLVRQVDGLHPDLIAITGDLFDSEAGSVKRLIPQLQRLRAPLGVYAVAGNHEFYAGVGRCTRLMQAAGFRVLDNAWVLAKPGLVVAGVPDHAGAGLRRALEGVPPDAKVILLQHSPEREEEAAAAGVAVMLDGHTHGGQIWPFHLPVRRFYPHLAGVYRAGSMTQVVSRGAGRWGPPMRLFAPADIVHLRLHRGGSV